MIKATKPPDAVDKLFAFKHCAYCKDMDLHNHHGTGIRVSFVMDKNLKHKFYSFTNLRIASKFCSNKVPPVVFSLHCNWYNNMLIQIDHLG